MQPAPSPQVQGRGVGSVVGLAAIALSAIAVGVATYAFARSQPALFLPTGWHRPLAHGLPGWLLAGMPTFVHATAMPLLTAIVLGSRRRATLLGICGAWAAVEIGFEAMQHPALRDALLSMLPLNAAATGWVAPFANYLRTGGFEWMDIAAALLASTAAYALLVCSRFSVSESSEVEHGQP